MTSEQRSTLIVQLQPIARDVARFFARRWPNLGLGVDDWEQEASIGVIRSVDLWEAGRLTIEAYAKIHATWACQHVVTRSDPAGPKARMTLGAARVFADAFLLEQEREPTTDEIEAEVPGYRAATLRGAARAIRSLDAPVANAPGVVLGDVCLADRESDPATRAAESDRADRLWRAVDELVPHAAAVLRGRYVGDGEFGEVARDLQLEVGTAKTRWHRGVRRLRRALRQADFAL